MRFSSSCTFTALFGLVSIAIQVQAAQRGLAWGANNAWATAFSNTSIGWYHHWQLPAISQMASNIEYIPMNWGPTYAAHWAARELQMATNLPKYILAYNEPDVPTQANMTPLAAAEAFVLELEPWRQKGVLVSSPQIVWNITWMDEFMTELQSLGSDVDFMAIHYYGSWSDTATPQAYIKNVNARYGKNVWITEMGTTLASAGSAAQTQAFMDTMMTWVDKQSYIDRVTWTGAFGLTTPPDDFIAPQDAMFYSNGTLRPIGTDFAQIVQASSSSLSTSTVAATMSTSKVTLLPTTAATSLTSSTKVASATLTEPSSASSSSISLSLSTSAASTKTKHHHHSSSAITSSPTSTSSPTKKICKVKPRINKGNVVSSAKQRR